MSTQRNFVLLLLMKIMFYGTGKSQVLSISIIDILDFQRSNFSLNINVSKNGKETLA